MGVKIKLLVEGNKMHIQTWLKIFSPNKEEITGDRRNV